MSRTPNYRLNTDFSYSASPGMWANMDQKVIPAGSYVRPLELTYVPKHVVEDKRWEFFNKDLDVFCYTKNGIIPIPRAYLSET